MINQVGRQVSIAEGEPVSQKRIRRVVNAPVSSYRRIAIQPFFVVHATGDQPVLLYDSGQLLQSSSRVRGMVKDPNGIAGIEGSLSEWRVKDISLDNQHVRVVSKIFARGFNCHAHVNTNCNPTSAPDNVQKSSR